MTTTTRRSLLTLVEAFDALHTKWMRMPQGEARDDTVDRLGLRRPRERECAQVHPQVNNGMRRRKRRCVVRRARHINPIQASSVVVAPQTSVARVITQNSTVGDIPPFAAQ